MASPGRALITSVAIFGLGAAVFAFALTSAPTAEPRSTALATGTPDPAALRESATAVARTVQATLDAQRTELATRVAAQSPVAGVSAPGAVATASGASPAVSPIPAASPVAIPPDPLLPPGFRFYRGINLGGAAEVIDGRPWLSDAQARAQGLTTPGATTIVDADDPISPLADAPTRRMLQSAVYVAAPDPLVAVQAVPNGTYAAYVYLVENHQDRYRTLDIVVEGTVVRAGWQAPRGGWEKLGPYTVAVSDGALDIEIRAAAGDALMTGLLIFNDAGAAGPSPVAVGAPRP